MKKQDKRQKQGAPVLVAKQLASVTGAEWTWKLGNKEWNDDWMAPK